MTPLIIVTAPSGAGKSSFCKRVVEDFPNHVRDSISCTTRKSREGEFEGNPYYFLTKEEFVRRRDKGHFIEWAEVYGNFYGTPKDQVEKAKVDRVLLVMDVDVQGAKSLRELYPDATYIFVLPPSIDELRLRLEKRDKGKTSNLKLRLEAASKEIAIAHEFDFQIINDDFERAYGEFKKIIEALLKQV